MNHATNINAPEVFQSNPKEAAEEEIMTIVILTLKHHTS